MHRRSWEPTVAALAGEFRVVTFDYRSARQLAAFEAHDVRDELHAIQAPTLVVEGELDLGLLVLGAEMIAQRVPNARLLMYPGVGHFPMAELAEQSTRTSSLSWGMAFSHRLSALVVRCDRQMRNPVESRGCACHALPRVVPAASPGSGASPKRQRLSRTTITTAKTTITMPRS